MLKEIVPKDVEDWFTRFGDHVKDIKVDVHDSAEAHEAQLEIEKSCSAIDQHILELEETTTTIAQCIDKIADLANQCQLSAAASNISANSISPFVIEKETQATKVYHAIIGFIHSISNWMFALND